MAGTDVVVDLANSPSFEAQAALDFFQTAGRNVLGAEARAGVRHHVALSVVGTEKLSAVGYFRGKSAQETLIRESGIPWVDLAPNSFFQNDLRYRAALLDHGVYPQPIGNVGVSRVDVRDIADVALLMLLGSGHEGRTIPIVGPEPQTGEQAAEVWRDHLGRHDPHRL